MPRTAQLDMTPTTLDTATGEVAGLLAGTKARLGFVPNMYGYMANLPGVLAGYMSTYAAFRETAGFTPPEQETVFLTISRVNGCSYCMAAHSMLADKASGVDAASLAALRAGTALPDPKLDALTRFTEAMVETRGMPGRAAVDAFIAAGFGEQQGLGVGLAIACKTFSNFTNHLAATPVDAVFQPYAVD